MAFKSAAEDPVAPLAALVDALRSRQADDVEAAGHSIEALGRRLGEDADARDALRAAVIDSLANRNRKTVHLLTDSGVHTGLSAPRLRSAQNINV